MKKQILSFAVAASAVFAFSSSHANAGTADMTPVQPVAQTQLTNECRWDPQGSSLCRGRNFCYQSVYHPKCQRYCSAYPNDRICYRR